MERDSPLIVFLFNIHHFPDQLLSFSDFGINLIVLNNLGMLRQMALIEFQYFPLQLVFFLVDES